MVLFPLILAMQLLINPSTCLYTTNIIHCNETIASKLIFDLLPIVDSFNLCDLYCSAIK
jgi:hypothetical protein